MSLSRIFCVALLTAAMIGLPADADTVVISIQGGNNDAEEKLNTAAISGNDPQGSIDLGSTDLELGSEGGGGLIWQVIAMQWPLAIPPGSTIDSAIITFTIDEGGSAGDNNFSILADAADNSAVFGGADFDITTRARTTASAAWAPPETDDIGSTFDTPDFSAVVQEVVDRAGWSENNMLSVMIYPDAYLALPDPSTGGTTVLSENTFESFNGTEPAVLTVEFTLPPPPPSVSSIDRVGAIDEAFISGTGEWTVTFSEEVDNVSDDDFSLELTGDAAANAPTVAAAKLTGTSFFVTSTGVSGTEGTLTLSFSGGDVVTVADGTAIPAKSGGKYSIGIALPAVGLLGLGLAAGAIAALGASAARRRKR